MFTFGKFQVQEKLFAFVSALVFSTACVSAAVGPAETVETSVPVQLASVDAAARA